MDGLGGRALELAMQLIRIPTVSRDSNHAATFFLENWLKEHGFATEVLTYHDFKGVLKSSVIGRRGPAKSTGGVAYFCHTDVVPAEGWVGIQESDSQQVPAQPQQPFEPVIMVDRLYGRGACDMKGSAAAFLAAIEKCPVEDQAAPIYVVATADEEVGFYGAADVAARSQLYRQLVEEKAAGIIGEPTELSVVHAHKGMYVLKATSTGRAAHSSTREGLNANLAMIDFLYEMKRLHDQTLTDPAWLDARFDPPWISWNIGINDFTHVVNMTPAQSVCTVSFRPMPDQQPDQLVTQVEQLAAACGLTFEVIRRGQPLYLDPASPFVKTMCELSGSGSSQTVSYGTDGTMFTEIEQMIVLGPGSIRQAHTADEFITLEQLQSGAELYSRIIRQLVTNPSE